MSILRTNQIQDTGTNVAANISGGTVTFSNTPNLSTGAMTNAPAFEAQLSSNQTFSDNVATKVAFDNKIFDTDGKYDASTNYRFTPTVSGKYFVYLLISVNANANSELQNMYTMLRKNGVEYKVAHMNFSANNARFAVATLNAIVTLDSDDYIEAYVQGADSSGSPLVQSGVYSTFGAYKLIGV